MALQHRSPCSIKPSMSSLVAPKLYCDTEFTSGTHGIEFKAYKGFARKQPNCAELEYQSSSVAGVSDRFLRIWTYKTKVLCAGNK